jgi:anti-anti-sigma factor
MATSEFKISQEQVQQATVFHLRGWLDAQSENGFIATVQEAQANGVKNLVLNMTEIDMLTSAGIRALQKLYKIFMDSGTASFLNIRLCGAPPQVYRVLSLTGFLQTMPMYETLQSALASL